MTEFKPNVQVIRARARRVVNTGRYQSVEITTEVEATPDPERKVSENVELLQKLVLAKVNAQCDAVIASLDKEA
jgi:hypothetical protein